MLHCYEQLLCTRMYADITMDTIVYILFLNHMEQHKVCLDSLSKRFQFVREREWAMYFAFFFFFFSPLITLQVVIINPNEVTAYPPGYRSFLSSSITSSDQPIFLIVISHSKRSNGNPRDNGFQVPLLLQLKEKQVSKQNRRIK